MFFSSYFHLIFDLRPDLEILQILTDFGHDGPYYFQDDITTKNRRVIAQAPQESSWHKEENEGTDRIID